MNDNEEIPQPDGDEIDVSDDLEDEVSDAEIRTETLRRLVPHETSSNAKWELVAATDESITTALSTPQGCLVRVIAWGMDGSEHHTTTWCPGVSIIALRAE